MSSIEAAPPDRQTIRRYFDDIASRYDLLNTLLSFRLDAYWRKEAVRLLAEGTERTLLDLGAGTGRFLEAFLGARTWRRAVALDFSEAMLQRAKETAGARAGFVRADFHDLPFAAESFDLVISAFTLRSVKDLPSFFDEVSRILTPQGKAAFLDLTRPPGRFWKALYGPYLRFYIPWLGRIVSGHGDAYAFLSQSVQSFQGPAETVRLLGERGFRKITQHPFTLGTATLIIARK